MMVELAVADVPPSVHRRAHKPWISIVGRGEASLHLGRRRARTIALHEREKERGLKEEEAKKERDQ
jgi:hypothetical protein